MNYLSISEKFNKQAPQAEVTSLNNNEIVEGEQFFQLLADYGINLNKPQREAVVTTENPLLLIAGAGTGKTMALTSRIGYMIHTKNIEPSSILLVTFTKKASTEMTERLARIPGIDRAASREVVAGTYHSVCLRILRREGYTFQVLSSEKRRHIMIKTILKRLNLHELYSAETVGNIISSWKNSLKRPQDIMPGTQVIEELKQVYLQYESIKASQNLYDFDDMLVETYYLFKFQPETLQKYQEKFKYVLCDEFQDSSMIQYEIIRMLAAPHNNLCVVGDDSQAIYGFRSSDARFMIDFNKVFHDCRKIVMDINYRSVPSIVGIGNMIIHHNTEQIKKTLSSVTAKDFNVMFNQPKTNDDEANDIVLDIKEKLRQGTKLQDIAVLYRTHATGRAIFDKLLLSDIPFITYGAKSEAFYENSLVKPILSILRCVSDPRNAEAIIEAAPIFYIKRDDMRQVVRNITDSYFGISPDDLFYQALKQLADNKVGYHAKQLIRKMDAVKELQGLTAPAAIMEVRKGAIGYEKQLEFDERKTLTVHKEMVLEILDECEQAARGFSSIQSFLTFVQKVEEKNKEMEELRMRPDIEAVRLMTIHASKGLEFDVVYAIGWSEGILPHAASISVEKKEDSPLTPEEAMAEERRLAYVCVTRAKRYLYLSSPTHHRNKEVQKSRFILEAMSIKASEKERSA